MVQLLRKLRDAVKVKEVEDALDGKKRWWVGIAGRILRTKGGTAGKSSL
jgi:hypothetical protein